MQPTELRGTKNLTDSPHFSNNKYTLLHKLSRFCIIVAHFRIFHNVAKYERECARDDWFLAHSRSGFKAPDISQLFGQCGTARHI